MRVTQTGNDKWRGSWVEVKNVSLVPHDNNLLVSQSTHSFELRNLTDEDLDFTIEYAHKLHEVVNGVNVDINVHRTLSGTLTISARDAGEPMRVWTHVDQERVHGWNPFRQMDYTGQDGKIYLLECYTALRPDGGQGLGNAIEARETDDTVL